MTVLAMITGRTVGEARQIDCKNGNKLTVFKLKVANGNAFEFWSVGTFDPEAQALLAELPEHYPLSITGQFQVEQWERDGKRGLNFKMTADTILGMRKKTTAKPRAKSTGKDRARQSWAAPRELRGAE